MAFGFTNIIAWQKAHSFVIAVYQKTATFPVYERHGLWSQFTRAAVSIAANIAEGSRRISKIDKLRFLNIAQGSLDECQYYIILAKDIKYISDDDAKELGIMLEGVSFFLNSYVEGIKNNNAIKD